MRIQFIFFLFFCNFKFNIVAQPCTLNNASGCFCPDASDTCTLYPDLTISWGGISLFDGGPLEFSHSGNGANNGRLRLTGITPNIGFGPLVVLGTNKFICGTDTIIDANRNPNCPGGIEATNILKQRIYKKAGNTMWFEEKEAGGQTFHPTHGHNHVDNWLSFSLHREEPNNPDTLSWEMIGNGAKVGFCLMDFRSCEDMPGFCRDVQVYNQGDTLRQADFPNFGLGGGSFNCSPIEQGISVGFLDLYDKNLDEMWIDIPQGICNGRYWIIAYVDPLNHFSESDENNNWTAVPIVLTRQEIQGSISLSEDHFLCAGESVILEAEAAQQYLWSTGATTKSITVNQAGIYQATLTTHCGVVITDSVEIFQLHPEILSTIGDSSCHTESLILKAEGIGTPQWFDAAINGSFLDSGITFITPVLQQSVNFYVADKITFEKGSAFSLPLTHSGINLFNPDTVNGALVFDALDDFVLKSVKVFSDTAATRIIVLKDKNQNIIASDTFMILSGTRRVNLNFYVPKGNDYQLSTDEDFNELQIGTKSPQLMRTFLLTNYPYVIPDFLSIKNSNNGPNNYYYFYDWEINYERACFSERTAVPAILNITEVFFEPLDSIIFVETNEVPLMAQPTGGVFSGKGVSGSSFFPAEAEIGGPYEISYMLVDARNCTTIVTQSVSVGSITSIANKIQNFDLNVSPNPFKEEIKVNLPKNSEQGEIQIFTIAGKKILTQQWSRTKDGENMTLNLKYFNTGIYLLKLQWDQNSVVTKISKL